MHIVKLVAENVKRLHAVEITPEGALITIGGKNGAGKSSVLDSIAYAMGGEKLVPSEPIRRGETEAKIVVDLGDLVVTRKFRRDLIHLEGCQRLARPDPSRPAQMGDCTCTPTFGNTVSILAVTNRDGARYPSPQAVLDKLLGKLTFDPLAFARADAKDQDAILRRLVNLDVTAIETRRKNAFERRAMLKKSHAIKAAQCAALPVHKDAPISEVSLDVIRQEMLIAERLRQAAENAERAVSKAQSRNEEFARQCVRLIAERDKLIAQLQAKNDELSTCQQDIDGAAQEVTAAQAAADAARAAVPDAETFRIKLTQTEVLNAHVRANQKAAAAQAEVEGLVREIAMEHQIIRAAEDEKIAMLAAIQFPIKGLGLSDDGVTFKGLPFSQAGSSEQIRVSVAIGIALNPQLKVLLIRNGNMLDHESLAAVADQAKAADMQVWMEYVSETKDGVAVMLVDGEREN